MTGENPARGDLRRRLHEGRGTVEPARGQREGERRYLDLLIKELTRTLHNDDAAIPFSAAGAPVGSSVMPMNPALRQIGHEWPVSAETMVGVERMQNVRVLLEDALRRGVPGDVIETGVWRGGVTILMRAVLAVWGDTERTVWVADSFEGLPKPDAEQFPADSGDQHHTFTFLAVPVEEVKRNFAKYNLLDEQVQFLVGWFKDTLPTAPIERLAMLRLDGDMYESTIEALDVLYPKLSPGGYCIIDDYDLPGCRKAVLDYREEHGILEPMHYFSLASVWWRRDEAGPVAAS